MKARAAKQYYTSFNAKAAKCRVAVDKASHQRAKPLKREWKRTMDMSFMHVDAGVCAATLVVLMAMKKRHSR